jgi:hypothetical protein
MFDKKQQKMKYTKEQAQEVLKDWFDYKETRSTTQNTYEKFIEDKFPSLDPTKEKLSELEDTIKKAQQEIQELKRLQK